MKSYTKKLEDALELLEAVQNSTSVANLVTDENYKLISYNRIFKEFILKYWSHEVMIGDDVTQFILPGNLADFKRDFLAALKGKITKGEHAYTLGKKRKMWIEAEYFPVVSKKEESPKVAFSFRNITRERLNEINIKIQNKKLKEIAFAQAHQLRGPVTSLLGLINLLRSNKKDTESRELYLDKIEALIYKTDEVIKSIVKRAENV